MTELELGPVDVVVIGYPPDAPKSGAAVAPFIDLVDRGIIRVLDVAAVVKNEDGTFSGFAAEDVDAEGFPDLLLFSGASTGLLGDEDHSAAADLLEPGSAALLIVYENHWAAPFVTAVRRNGGELLAFDRIGVGDLMDVLESSPA